MKIYYLPLEVSPWNSVDEHLLMAVSPERRKKIKQYTYAAGQRLSLYAALVSRMGISLLTDIPANKLVFQADSGCKPVCLSAPDLDFSFSHTKNAVLCCISTKGSVGADIELKRPAPLNVAKRFFHKEEAAYVMDSAGQEQDLRFFEIWTKKEAYSKQLGLGFQLSPKSYNTLTPALSSQLHTWRQDEYLCSVCCNSPFSTEKIAVTESNIQAFFS